MARAGAGEVGYLALHPQHGQLSFQQMAHAAVELANAKDLSVCGGALHRLIVRISQP
ncbi:MAG: hypothetical protein P8H52_09535 [Porticoccaceae bacterium]|nr:hypothetical protein [Porticoccaceae bacterium]